MSKLWDDLKENMKDWSNSAVEKAEEMSRIAMAKTEEMTRISKIKFEIHQLQRDMNRAYEELGKLAYSHTKKTIWPRSRGIRIFRDRKQGGPDQRRDRCKRARYRKD